MTRNSYGGLFIAFDGPNGAGKSTLIEHVSRALLQNRVKVSITKEPTDTSLGDFTRQEAENIKHNSLACLVAADRYNHLNSYVIPLLKNEHVIITDRYILSSLVLQRMDDVDMDFILAINQNVVLPDLQIVVMADPNVIQRRLDERKQLTRFERGNRALQELQFFQKGVEILDELGVKTITIDNSDNLNANVESIVQLILGVVKY